MDNRIKLLYNSLYSFKDDFTPRELVHSRGEKGSRAPERYAQLCIKYVQVCIES